MKDKILLPLVWSFFFIISPAHSEDVELPYQSPMAIIVEGTANIIIPFAGGTVGGGIRYEYALSPVASLIFPVEYRYVATSGFSESIKFEIITAGIGSKFYFSQLFWQQQSLRGFFLEGRIGVGYANEKAGAPNEKNNTGATFALSASLGYSHAFDFGLIVGGSVGTTARGFTPPIQQPLIYMHPVPEIGVSVGWVF